MVNLDTGTLLCNLFGNTSNQIKRIHWIGTKVIRKNDILIISTALMLFLNCMFKLYCDILDPTGNTSNEKKFLSLDTTWHHTLMDVNP